MRLLELHSGIGAHSDTVLFGVSLPSFSSRFLGFPLLDYVLVNRLFLEGGRHEAMCQ